MPKQRQAEAIAKQLNHQKASKTASKAGEIRADQTESPPQSRSVPHRIGLNGKKYKSSRTPNTASKPNLQSNSTFGTGTNYSNGPWHMRFKHRDIVISAFFTIFLCGSQACYGDIIIDRFNVKEDGNVIFSENDFFNINGDGTVLLAKGRADWTTGGATNRIAGGTRTVGFGPHTGAYDFSQFRLQGNGELAVSTGTAASANVKLSYNTNALEQDFVTNGQWLNLNLRGDATAGSALTLNLTFNGTEQVSVSLDKMKTGNNAFDLSTMDGFSNLGSGRRYRGV